jgi:hypothetical protein
MPAGFFPRLNFRSTTVSYDSWKARNPADEFLGPEPVEEPTIITRYWPKPIPLRQFDWSAVTDDYEPGDPIGYGRTEAEAINDLAMLIAWGR